jgi:hypothetical protein
VNREFDIKWKEMVMAYFEILFQNLSGETDEDHEIFSRDMPPVDRKQYC